MDSIRFDLRGFYTKERQVITIEKIKRQRARKWAIGVQAGYGYGFKSKQFEPYVGIGISYKF